MYDLSKITPKELSELIHGKKQFEIEIPNSATQFKKCLPNLNFSTPQEVAPSPAIITADVIAHVILLSGNDLKGRYTQFVVFVYALGGIIHYTETTSGRYKASVTWPNA
jgi:hypothetical protein